MAAFQFLIGTIKTVFVLLSLMGILLVSIPYRYYKNEVRGVYIDDDVLMFQFLIGTIKTDITDKDCLACVVFQFLIGTIKTWAL